MKPLAGRILLHSDELESKIREETAILEQEIIRRTKAEGLLREKERFLPDPTWVIDTDGRVVAWNLAMERVSGVEKKDMIGKGDYAYAIPLYGDQRPILIDFVLKRDKKNGNQNINP